MPPYDNFDPSQLGPGAISKWLTVVFELEVYRSLYNTPNTHALWYSLWLCKLETVCFMFELNLLNQWCSMLALYNTNQHRRQSFMLAMMPHH